MEYGWLWPKNLDKSVEEAKNDSNRKKLKKFCENKAEREKIVVHLAIKIIEGYKYLYDGISQSTIDKLVNIKDKDNNYVAIGGFKNNELDESVFKVITVNEMLTILDTPQKEVDKENKEEISYWCKDAADGKRKLVYITFNWMKGSSE